MWLWSNNYNSSSFLFGLFKNQYVSFWIIFRRNFLWNIRVSIWVIGFYEIKHFYDSLWVTTKPRVNLRHQKIKFVKKRLPIRRFSQNRQKWVFENFFSFWRSWVGICSQKKKRCLKWIWGAKIFRFDSCSHAAFADVFRIFHKWLNLFYWYFVLYHFAEVLFMTWMRLNFRQNLHLNKWRNNATYSVVIVLSQLQTISLTFYYWITIKRKKEKGQSL